MRASPVASAPGGEQAAPGADATGLANNDPALDLAAEFYRLWNPAAPGQPGPRDREQAAAVLATHGDEAPAVVACLVQVTRREWPDCRSLSGAVQKYLSDAERFYRQQKAREQQRRQAVQQRQQTRQEEVHREQAGGQIQQQWNRLPQAQRDEIERLVRSRLGGQAPAFFVRRLCLEELARRQG